jgi:hypothetical protein
VIERAENQPTRNENNKHTEKKNMRNNLSFVSIVQPCSSGCRGSEVGEEERH